MSEQAVIIGAGGTGRGFLARLLKYDDTSLVFIDTDKRLIQELNTEKSYQISLGRETCTINNYEAYHADDREAAARVAEADWIFTAVGNEHLTQIVPLLEKAGDIKAGEALKVVTCENGTNPKMVLKNALDEKNVRNVLVTQAIVFCTSIPESKATLDILSENYNQLPYDTDEELFEMPFSHMTATKNFSQLLERKIYTYNCLSACIAYLGADKGYLSYADAANDKEILNTCHKLLDGLNRAICKEYQVPEWEQKSFSDNALKKFRNPAISDTIQKNARAAIRKISPNERIMGPIKLMLRHGENPQILYMVLAAALRYLEEHEKTQMQDLAYEDPIALLAVVNPDIRKEIIDAVTVLYHELREDRAGTDMKEFLSYVLSPEDAVWPSEPVIEITQCTAIGKDGNFANTFKSILPNHCGTHYDAPFHFNMNGPRITELPMEYFWFDNVAVLEIPKGPEEGVQEKELREYEKEIRGADLLLLKTGFYRFRSAKPEIYSARGPYLDPDACRYLIDNFPDLRCVGFDFLSIGSPCNDLSVESHKILLGCYSKKFITGIEDMNLEPLYRIDKKIRRVIAAPLRIAGVDSGQVCVIAEFE